MTALLDWNTASDAELANAAAAGDRGAFGGIYDRYADRLHDFCIGMVRDRDAAADCVQDVFCTAATILPQLRDPDKLRPWLYSIARHQALRAIRQRRREQPSEEVLEAASEEAGPDTVAAGSELADLIADAASGLSERDRLVLELAYRHGLDGPELAEALGVSGVNAKKFVQRLRDTLERCLGALLVARHAHRNPDGCPQLGAILHGWDGQLTILMRKRVARHIESCPICDQERRRRVNPVALLGAVPVFIPAPGWLRERTLANIQLTSLTTPTAESAPGSVHLGPDPVTQASTSRAAESDTATPDHAGDANTGRTRQLIRYGSVFLATLFVAAGLTITWLHYPDAPITPTELTKTTPKPTGSGASATIGETANTPPPSPADELTATTTPSAVATSQPPPVPEPPHTMVTPAAPSAATTSPAAVPRPLVGPPLSPVVPTSKFEVPPPPPPPPAQSSPSRITPHLGFTTQPTSQPPPAPATPIAGNIQANLGFTTQPSSPPPPR
jgi:RNA polymerase sigma factor (sigma-70 family)